MLALNTYYLMQKVLLTINSNMKRSFFIFLFGIASMFSMQAQTIVKGSVKLKGNFEPIPDVIVTFEGTETSTSTDASGMFEFTTIVPLGEQYLKIVKEGFVPARYPVVVNEGQALDIDMFLQYDLESDQFTITLSDDELNDDDTGADNISGLLSSSKDVFQRTAAFEFSPSFFRVRGLDSDNGSVLINGIEMNKLYSGRPQWSNWGGLNDVVRNQELTTGLTPSAYNFGGILGTTNISTRASKYRQGGRVTYSSSNRSYTNRLMASYASGLTESGWAYTLMLGRRWGNEGYQDATLYDSNSFFASVEKKINDQHSINFTGIYAPNRRGKSSPNTLEVFDLKDIRYNEYWGYQDGTKRNSRIKEVEEPIVMLNHFWDINEKTSLNTNFAYQFGKLGNSRIDSNGTTRFVNGEGEESFEGGGANPSPAYYQLLPSYLLRNFPENPEFAYGAQQDFVNDGQINWDSMYQANSGNASNGYNAIYALYEDRVDDSQFTVNTILNTELKENIILNASINYKSLKSENFAEIIDLLGGSGYLNVDGFDGVQFDLRNPNRIAVEGDKFRYNYNLYANILSAYAQAQFKYNKVDFYVAGSFTSTSYQREGLYETETFPGDRSFGKGKKLSFDGLGLKLGGTYKITGKHLVDVNAGYIQRAPSLRNTFSNSRENHDIVGEAIGEDITEEKITSLDASYIFRSPIVKARLTGFYTKTEDANEISFFYADGIGQTVDINNSTGFLQEILQGVDKRHVGAEFGIEAQVTPTIKLKAAGSYGQYTYDNNPRLYITSNDIIGGFTDFGTTSLKDYKLAGGPQKAYSVGFEYRDPDYWWFGATANFFDETYIDVSPLNRSSNFYEDPLDGQVFNDYDPALAKELLRQEEFGNYMVVNLVGGKSWKIDDYFVGFFASVGNLLDEEYRTGGFEQGRNANFRQLRDDKALDTPVFGPKYWFGRGTNYFLNVYFRF